MKRLNYGMLLGFIGVAMFALTLPATRYLVDYLDPLFIGLGRGVIAALAAALLLLLRRQPLPSRDQLPSLLLVSVGVVIGFPVLSAMAMETLPSAHGGVVLGVLPLATAIVAFFINRERPSLAFWLVSLLGAGIVLQFLGFSFSQTNLEYPNRKADFLLLGAIVSAALGYAAGAKLTYRLGGWQVICWALVISLPFTIIPTLLSLQTQPHLSTLPTVAILAFLYLAFFSQLIGFFFWYKGLALGGVARVSQLQLLQPFLTLFASAWLLHEIVDLRTWLFAFLVILTVALSRQTRIDQPQPKTTP